MKLSGKKVMSILLIGLLCTAIFLNYNYNNEDGTKDNAKLLGEAAYVNNDVLVEDEIDSLSSLKLERQKAKEYSLSLLDKIINDEKSSLEAQNNAQNEKIKIANSIVNESDCETILTAKGFENVIVTISDNTATVSLKSDALVPAQVAQIQEIVSTSGKIPPENIKIILSR